MNYELVAGILFGVGFCATLHLIYTISRTQSIDLNLITKEPKNNQDMEYLREDIGNINDVLIGIENRLEVLEGKFQPKGKKKA